MAYFTDPMGDEFRKAIEDAMKQLEDEEKKPKRKKKNSTKRYSTKTKKALK
jgi:hypothetical protein